MATEAECIFLNEDKRWTPVRGKLEMKKEDRIKDILLAYGDWLGGIGHFQDKGIRDEIKDLLKAPLNFKEYFKVCKETLLTFNHRNNLLS